MKNCTVKVKIDNVKKWHSQKLIARSRNKTELKIILNTIEEV